MTSNTPVIPITSYDAVKDEAKIVYESIVALRSVSYLGTAANTEVKYMKSGITDTIAALESPATLKYLAGVNTATSTGLTVLGANVAGTNVGSASSGTTNIINYITYGSAATGVKYTLPAIAKGLCYTIFNTHASSALSIYPVTGDYIDALAVDTAVSIPVGGSKTFYTKSISATATAKKGWFSL